MIRKLFPLLVSLLVFIPCLLRAQEAITEFIYRAGDKDSGPHGFVEFNALMFFSATTESEGSEVWVSDGSIQNTHILKDIYPGFHNGISTFSSQSTAVLNNSLFFIAHDGVNGDQLWKTQGTSQTTIKVSDLPDLKITKMTLVGDHLFFLARVGQILQVWKSNGTRQGTVVVKEIIDIWNQPSFEGEANNLFFFTIQPEGSNNSRLWRSDGTAAGTFPLTDEIDGNGAGRGTSSPTQYIQFNNELYLVVRSQTLFAYPNTVGILKTDGSLNNTVPVLGLHPGNTRLITYADVLEVNNKLYFSFFEADYRRTFIWESDGTAAGTKLIYDESGSNYYIPSNLSTDGSNLIFTGRNANDETSLLTLKLDTYEKKEVKSLAMGTEQPFIFTFSDVANIKRLTNNTFTISVPLDFYERKFWMSDLSASGTSLIEGLPNITNYISFKEKVYFSYFSEQVGQELWRSDLHLQNAQLFANINTSKHGLGSGASYYASLQDKLLFPAYTPALGHELWGYNTTTKEVGLVKDLEQGTASSSPAHLTSFKDHVYFTAFSRAHGPQLWRTNGTEAGTALFGADIGLDRHGAFANFVVQGDRMFFTTLQNDRVVLCTTDGTTATVVKDLGVNSYGVAFMLEGKIVPAGSLVYFVLRGEGEDLWRSDGTAVGTYKIKDLLTARNLTAVNGTLFFTARENNTSENELWKSDGSAAGTAMVKDIGQGYSSNPDNFFSFGDELYFSAYTKEWGKEMWKSDGTAEGSKQITDINPGSASSMSITDYAVLDNTLYFSANDGVHGQEIWKTDGTPDGTRLVRDIHQGAIGSFPYSFFSTGTQLYFSAYTETNGFELWSSTGETATTQLASNLLSGPAGSAPSDFMLIDNALFFFAETSNMGRQLWKLDLSSVTGTEDFDQTSLLSLYPNPSADYLYIDYKNRAIKGIRILTMEGKEIAVSGAELPDRIHIGHLPTGIYLLVMESENKRLIKKFIKR